jgi:hypothetical protein
MNTKVVDKGDTLTQEQIEAATNQQAAAVTNIPTEAKMSDEDVAAAVKALTEDPVAETAEEKTAREAAEAASETDEQKATREAAETAAAAEEEANLKKAGGVPQKRFNEAVGKERTRADSAEDEIVRLRRENDQLRSGVDPAAPVAKSPAQVIQALEDDLDTKRETYEDAIADGDKDARKTARTAVREAEAAIRVESSNQVEARARTGSTQDNSYSTALTVLEAEYPQINPDVKEFDTVVTGKLVTLTEGLMRGGMSRVDALQEASEIYLLPTKKEGTTTNLVEAGKKTVIKATKQTPPDLSAIGSARADLTPTLKPSRMNEKQYSDLDEETRAMLRGDNPVEENAA